MGMSLPIAVGRRRPASTDRLISALTRIPLFKRGGKNGAIIRESMSFDLDGAEIPTMR
jgi:hypothetical protein